MLQSSPCKLAFEDGCIFTGHAFGATGTAAGEVVFNTGLTGYQEVFSDPSYCGQIVTMTFPLIGNYGVNAADFEAVRPALAGFVVKELPPRPSNYRATGGLADLLREFGIIGLVGVDTRALTRRIRVHGALRGVISTEVLDDVELVRMAAASPVMNGLNLVTRVSPSGASTWTEGLSEPEAQRRASGPAPDDVGLAETRRCAPGSERGVPIVVLDCGIKQNILRHLASCGCAVTVMPAASPAGAILDCQPAALVVSNGPGDPAAVTDTIATLRELAGRMPILGICLGHQMLALALGAQTYKLRFGHHGVNVPVWNEPAGRVEITSQNHGFAVETASLERVGGVATHLNLNDRSLEGFVHPDMQIVALQFHPEASPGPHDAAHVFRGFVEALRAGRAVDAAVLRG